MLPLLRILELMNLSLADAEAAGFNRLAEASKRCRRCTDTTACIHWLKWSGRNGRAPECLNASYFEEVRKRSRSV